MIQNYSANINIQYVCAFCSDQWNKSLCVFLCLYFASKSPIVNAWNLSESTNTWWPFLSIALNSMSSIFLMLFKIGPKKNLYYFPSDFNIFTPIRIFNQFTPNKTKSNRINAIISMAAYHIWFSWKKMHSFVTYEFLARHWYQSVWDCSNFNHYCCHVCYFPFFCLLFD